MPDTAIATTTYHDARKIVMSYYTQSESPFRPMGEAHYNHWLNDMARAIVPGATLNDEQKEVLTTILHMMKETHGGIKGETEMMLSAIQVATWINSCQLGQRS